jgi:prepilin peptidase CpaA
VLEYPLLFVFPAAMIFAAAMDLFTMTIPNRVSLALLLAFLGAAPLSGMEWPVIFSHLLLGAATLAVGIVLFARGWVGGGDAKLLAATVLWVGPDHIAAYLILVSIMGGVLAISILIYRGLVLPSWVTGQTWALRLHDKAVGIPYGIALAGAGLWIYPKTEWFAALAA